MKTASETASVTAIERIADPIVKGILVFGAVAYICIANQYAGGNYPEATQVAACEGLSEAHGGSFCNEECED